MLKPGPGGSMIAWRRTLGKKPSLWTRKKYFGKYGFISKSRKSINSTNIDYLETNLGNLPKDTVSNENGFYSIDLSKLGFDKLLSNGRVSNKYKIKVQNASKKAIEKIKSSGGEVILLEQKK